MNTNTKIKRSSCSSSGYSSQSLTSEYDLNKINKTQICHPSINNHQYYSKNSSTAKKQCFRSSSTSIYNQTTSASAASSFCIRTSTPTSSQTLHSQNINTNGCKSLINSTCSSTTHQSANLHPFQNVYLFQNLNKNLATSISTITSETDSLRTRASSIFKPNKNFSNFIYPIKEHPLQLNQNLPQPTKFEEKPKQFSIWSFIIKIFSFINIFRLFKSSKPSQSQSTINMKEADLNYSEIHKNKPVYYAGTGASYNFPITSTGATYKSKHSTPLKYTQQDIPLNLISPVALEKSSKLSEINSAQNINNLTYIDAEPEIELYDNVPVQENTVKLELLKLNHQQKFKSLSSSISPLKSNLDDDNKTENDQDELEEYYIKINPLHLKLKQMESESVKNNQNPSNSLFKNLDKKESPTSSTQSLDSTNYDNDLEIISNRQDAQLTPSSSGSESAFSISNNKIRNSNDCFKTLSSSSICSSGSNLSSESDSNSVEMNPQILNDCYLSLINLSNKQQLNPSHVTKPKNLVKTVQIKYPLVHKSQISHHQQMRSNNISYQNQRQYIKRHFSSNPGSTPIYDDYLCDKEVESYFDNSVYFDCFKNQLTQPQPAAALTINNNNNNTSFYSNSGVILINKRLNSNSYLINPLKVVNSSNSFSSLSVSSSSAAYSSTNSVFYNKNLIGAGCVRQIQGESFC